jgi:uncharacterized protein with LGFP repeats
MGYPTGEPFCGLLRGGCAQYFQKGSIYWSPGSSAHFVRGAIKAKWGTMGWERGMLGYPISDEFCGLRDGGCGQHFQNGSVYWSLSGGAHYVRGGIRERWKAQRWESGSLGYPVSDEFCGLVRGGCGQHFQHGSIYWSPSTPAVMVVNPIRAAWGSAGWEHGRYGYPIGEAYHSGAYWYQRFQGGTVRAR